MKMSPEVGASSPAIMRRSVDLPQPDGPTSTTNSPSSIDEIDVGEHLRRAVALVDACRCAVAPLPNAPYLTAPAVRPLISCREKMT